MSHEPWQRNLKGGWHGRWGVNYLYGTWSVLRGLEAAGLPPEDPAVARAAAWLEDRQNADGGWGESCDSYADPAVAGRGQTRLAYSVLAGADACGDPIGGEGNLLDDVDCGLPVRPPDGLLADGRVTFDSNAVDAGPAAGCPADDLRGEARPADGDRDGMACCDAGAFEFQPRLTVVHNPTLKDDAHFAFGGIARFAGEQPEHAALAVGNDRLPAPARDLTRRHERVPASGSHSRHGFVDVGHRNGPNPTRATRRLTVRIG